MDRVEAVYSHELALGLAVSYMWGCLYLLMKVVIIDIVVIDIVVIDVIDIVVIAIDVIAINIERCEQLLLPTNRRYIIY